MRKYFVILWSCLGVAAGFGFADHVTDMRLGKVSEVFHRADVQKELDVLEDQVQAVRRIESDYGKKVDELERDLKDIPPQELAARVEQLVQKLNQDRMVARQDVLLPFQARRLDEIAWQYQSLEDPVGTFDLALNLSEEQDERLRNRETELRSELLTQLESFKQRAEREILELLTPDQRRELSQKTGKEFHFESSERGLTSLKRLR